MPNKIIGVFNTPQNAIKAINDIKQQGYSTSDISAIAKNSDDISTITNQTGVQKQQATSQGTNNNTNSSTNNTNNSTNGGFMEEIASFFFGDTNDDTNNNNTSSNQGGATNQLTQMGLSKNEANQYNSYLNDGNILVVVNADTTGQSQVNNAFRTNNSVDIMTSGSNQTGNNTGTNATVRQSGTEPKTIQLHEEHVNITKDRVKAGEVQLKTDVVEEQQTLGVPVTHEEVYIERHPVTNGQADNTSIGNNKTIRIPVMAEKVNVTKTPVVTEEIVIGVREVQEIKQITETVKHEEVQLDSSGNPIIQGKNQLNNASNNTSNTMSNNNTSNTAGGGIGEAVGTVGGGVAGAAVGSVFGPLGTVAGGLAGGALGNQVGEGAGGANNDAKNARGAGGNGGATNRTEQNKQS